LLRNYLWLGAALAGTTTAMAETPAPTLIGAKRVVIACQFDSSIPEADHDALCGQIIAEAKKHTNLPVSQATPADLKLAMNMREQSEQLLLRVKAEVVNGGADRKPLALRITPVRLANATKLTPVTSSATLVRAAGEWTIEGAGDGFRKIFG
jgi:hypothetical protein